MDQLKSKSQKKREADALRELGVALTSLRIDQLNNMQLPEALYLAIVGAKKITSHGALRRQGQLIGKLMRLADSDKIFEQYIKTRSTKTAHLLKRFEHLPRNTPDDQSNI